VKWEGIIAGLAVAGLNGALALAAVRWGLAKGMQVFLVACIGGMALRLLLVAVLSVLVIKLTSVHVASYTISLIVTYLLFLLLEMLYVLKKNKAEKTAVSKPDEVV
jgi:Ca2+/Na+ antiporter